MTFLIQSCNFNCYFRFENNFNVQAISAAYFNAQKWILTIYLQNSGDFLLFREFGRLLKNSGVSRIFRESWHLCNAHWVISHGMTLRPIFKASQMSYFNKILQDCMLSVMFWPTLMQSPFYSSCAGGWGTRLHACHLAHSLSPGRRRRSSPYNC
jgi:hypothetical protein